MMKTRLPPYGFRQLLGRAPEFDMRDQGAPVELKDEEGLFPLLTKVQRKVNREFKYASDRWDYWDHSPVEKTWKGWLSGKIYTRKYGDCEDYALAKYQELEKEGIPKEALRLILCRYKTTYHLVLGVTTEKCVFILDNRTKAVWWKSKDKRFMYDWISWSVPGRMMWESLE